MQRTLRALAQAARSRAAEINAKTPGRKDSKSRSMTQGVPVELRVTTPRQPSASGPCIPFASLRLGVIALLISRQRSDVRFKRTMVITVERKQLEIITTV